MFTAKVYRVMVGSLSGAMEEVYVAKETIRKWNQQNAERTGKVFMPVEWSTSLEAIQDTDIVVGFIGSWIDNSQFVEGCIDAGKQVMLLFNLLQDPTNTISGEQKMVNLFFDQMQHRCYCSYYHTLSELAGSLTNCLDVVQHP